LLDLGLCHLFHPDIADSVKHHCLHARLRLKKLATFSGGNIGETLKSTRLGDRRPFPVLADGGGEASGDAPVTLEKNELELAAKLIDGFSGPWKPEQYKELHRESCWLSIKAKTKAGPEPKLKDLEPAAPHGEVADLMERLRASLDAGRGGPAAPVPAPKCRARAGSRRRGNPVKRPGGGAPFFALSLTGAVGDAPGLRSAS
jgi:hypothetical protein